MRNRNRIGLLFGLCVLLAALTWAEPNPEEQASTGGNSHSPYALPVAVGVFVVLWGASVAGVMAWNRAIKRKVRERTKELEARSDQLRIANEEAEVANEELQTQSEELESLNEELSITNEDLEKKAQELSAANEELKAALVQQEKDHEQITFLASIVESTMDSVIATDIKGRIIYVNPATERIFGYTADELIGQPAGKLNASRSAPDQEEEILRKTLKEGWEGELTDRRRDGAVFPFWTATSKIVDEAGKVIALVGIGRDITERKRVEEALKKSEEKYRNLVETMEEGIGVVDEKETFTFVNRAAAHLFGYSKDELIGKSLRELTTPEAFQRVLDQTSVRKTGKSSEYELTVVRKDGASRIIAVTATPIIGDDGRYRGYFWLFRDITERKRAENRLAVAREITRIANSSLNVQKVYQAFFTEMAKLVAFDRSEIAVLNASGEILIPLASAFEALLSQHKTKHLLRGTGVEWTFEHLAPLYEPDLEKERRFPESRALFEEGIRSCVILPLIYKGKGIGALSLASGNPNAYSEEDVSILDQIAGQIATSVRNMQLFKETHQRAEYLEGLHQVGMAITSELDLNQVLKRVYEEVSRRIPLSTFHIALYDEERRNLHFELRVEEGKFIEKHARDFSEDGGLTEWVIRSRQSLLIRDWKKECEHLPVKAKIIGMPTQSLLTVPLLIHDRAIGVMSVQSNSVNAFHERHQRILEIVAHQVAIATENARLFESLRKKNEDLYAQTQELERAYGELQQTQEQLVQTEKLRALGEMASGVAHDFNNLLGGILGWTQLMQLRPGNKEDVERGLRLIKRAALDGAETVRRIQEFTRVRRDKTPGRVDVNEVVRGAVEVTRPKWKDQAQRAGITIAVETVLGKVETVEGSASDLREVLINLILNAVDAMPQGGTICLRTEMKGDEVCLSIADTGVGMSETVRQKIFDPFFSTKGMSGDGLGLSMAYGIVTRHGGKISVESAEGRGATFTIRLPGSPEGMEIMEKASPITEAAPMRILVIDDDESIRLVLSEMLESMGHYVAIASGGKAGVERFSEERFDIVFTDLGMPGMSGWDVAGAIKETNPDTILFLVTGWGIELPRRQLEESGVYDVIPKPFKMEELTRKIAEVAKARKTW